MLATSSSETASKSSPLWTWFVPLLLVALYVLHCTLVYYVSDDGFIAFQYIKHFALGDGFVYNADERVEGYTNFLWVALLGCVFRLAPHLDLLLLAQCLGVLCGATAIWLVCHFSRNVAKQHGPWSALAGAFLAAHTSFVAWSTSGLESVMFALFLLVAAYSYVAYLRTGKRFWLPAVIFSLLAMVRPDGLLFAGLTSLHFVVWEWRRQSTRPLARPAIWMLLILAIYGSYFAARFAYYGEPLHNVFYAKIVGTSLYEEGWAYLSRYAVTHGLLVFVAPVWLLLRRDRREWQDYFALLVISHLVYMVYVGGDGLKFFRFFVHIVPLLYLLVQAGYAECYIALRRRVPSIPNTAWATAGVTLVVLSLAYTGRQGGLPLIFPEENRWFESHSQLHFPGIGSDHDYVWFDNYFVDRQAIAAQWLEENAEPNSLVASTPAGSIAYHMNHRVIDMLGLNDHHIARTPPGNIGYPRVGHMKGDGAYVLSRKPDYILMGNVAVLPFALDESSMAKKLVRKSEYELWNAPRFHRNYELVSVQLADQGIFRYFTFYKKRAHR